MTLAWREHPDAHAELISAALELDEIHPGLGDLLVDAVETSLASIIDTPQAWPPLPGQAQPPQVRSRSVSPFPLRVVYTVESEMVLVLAYAHERRRPRYWENRLGRS